MRREILLSKLIDQISMGPFGSDIKVDNFIPYGVPVLNGSNLTDVKLVERGFNFISEEKANSLGKANAKRGDIVITHRGTLGQVSYIPDDSKFERYVISQSQFRVRFKKEVNPIYLAYLFQTQYGQSKLLSFKNHVGVPALAQATTNFKLLELSLHERTEQDEIAAVLSSLDDKIELNNKINAELEAMAKTLYDYWFVQFDFPDENGKPYKSSGGKMVWDEKLKREIPAGWEAGTIYDVGEVLGGGTPRKDKPEFWNGSIPFFTPRDFENSTFIIDTEEHITKLGLDSCSSRLYPKGTVFITARGTVGNINIASTDMAMNQSCYAVQAKSHINYYFLHQYCKHTIDYMKVKAGGSVFDALVSNDFKFTPTVIPSTEMLELFGKTISSFYEKILINRKENQKLSELRDWLLPMLMNGQVSVGEAYEDVEEALILAAEPQAGYSKTK